MVFIDDTPILKERPSTPSPSVWEREHKFKALASGSVRQIF